MEPLAALWHLLNFFAPALGTAAVAAAAAKLIWRRRLAGVPYLGLALWAALAGMIVLLAGLMIIGHDGKMATYAALVLANAAALWFKGLRRAASAAAPR